MKIGQQELDRLNWFGLKSALSSVLALPLINPALQFAGSAILPRNIAHRLPLSRRSVTYQLEQGGAVRLLDPLHDIVARDIHWGGGKPDNPSEQLKMRCIERLSARASTFVDIGAYSGLCALVAARSNPKLHAIAFEIVPENYLLLVRNIIENDLSTRVEPRLRGIGADVGTVRMPTSLGLASHPTSMSIGSAFEQGTEVGIDRLAAQLVGCEAPFFLKIDVEGYEKEVFQGAAEFIAEFRPDIICEVLPDAAEACEAIEAILRPLGYHFWVFSNEAVVGRDRLLPERVPRDWLLSPRQDIAQMVADISIA